MTAALVHAEDLADIGIDTGDWVRIDNRRANVVVQAKSVDGVQRGAVVAQCPPATRSRLRIRPGCTKTIAVVPLC